MKGVRDAVSIFLSTGYCVGTVVAMILNGILPPDIPIEDFEMYKSSRAMRLSQMSVSDTNHGWPKEDPTVKSKETADVAEKAEEGTAEEGEKPTEDVVEEDA